MEATPNEFGTSRKDPEARPTPAPMDKDPAVPRKTDMRLEEDWSLGTDDPAFWLKEHE